MTPQTALGRLCRRAAGPAGLAILMLAWGLELCAAAGSIAVEQPWMRFIIKAHPAAGYFTLRNGGDTAKQLTGASSTACGMLMMHQSKQEDWVDKMLPVKRVTVPAHGSVAFAPGGYHLMCMSPTNAMAIGANVPVTLRFSDGTSLAASFPVKGPSGK